MSGHSTQERQTDIDPYHMRGVLGRLPTAVVVVTAIGPDGAPVGMTVGTFNSVSLDPPMVGFMPDKKSSTWPIIRESGSFCANVLSDRQEDVCRRFARKNEERFVDTNWFPGPSGSPILAGATAWIDCDLAAVHDAGDHHIALGRVNALEVQNTHLPLVFLQGAYGRIASLSFTAWDRTILKPMRLADIARADMEQLASSLGRECILSAVVEEEVVMLANADAAGSGRVPTRVGQRLPLASPLAGIFLAWSSPELQRQWIEQVTGGGGEPVRERLTSMLSTIRDRGYSVATGRELHVQIEAVLRASTDRRPEDAPGLIAPEEQFAHVEPASLDQAPGREARSLAVPVFGPDGAVLLTLGLHRLPPSLTSDGVTSMAARARQAARRIEVKLAELHLAEAGGL